MSDSLESQILANASKDDAASKPTSSALSTDFLPEDIQLFIELYTAKLRKTITTSKKTITALSGNVDINVDLILNHCMALISMKLLSHTEVLRYFDTINSTQVLPSYFTDVSQQQISMAHAITKLEDPHYVDIASAIHAELATQGNEDSFDFLQSIPRLTFDAYGMAKALVDNHKITWCEAIFHRNALAYIAQCAALLSTDKCAQGGINPSMPAFAKIQTETFNAIVLATDGATLIDLDDDHAPHHLKMLTDSDTAFAARALLILQSGITPLQILSFRPTLPPETEYWTSYFLSLASVLIEAGKMTFDQFLQFSNKHHSSFVMIRKHWLQKHNLDDAYCQPSILQLAREYLASLEAMKKERATERVRNPLEGCLFFTLIAQDVLTIRTIGNLLSSAVPIATMARRLMSPQVQQLLQLNILNWLHLVDLHFEQTHDALRHLTLEQINNLFVVQGLKYDDISDQTHNQLLAKSMRDHRPEMHAAIITLPLPEGAELDGLAVQIDAHPFTKLGIRSVKNLRDDVFNRYLTHRELDWITDRISAQRRLQSLDFIAFKQQHGAPLSLLIQQSRIPDPVKRFIACLNSAPHLSKLTPPKMALHYTVVDALHQHQQLIWEDVTFLINHHGHIFYCLASAADADTIFAAQENLELSALQSLIAPNAFLEVFVDPDMLSNVDFWQDFSRRNREICQLIESCYFASQNLIKSLITSESPEPKTDLSSYRVDIRALRDKCNEVPPGTSSDALEALIAWFTYLDTGKSNHLNTASRGFQTLVCPLRFWHKVMYDYTALVAHFVAQGMAHALQSRVLQPVPSAENGLNEQDYLAQAYFSCLPAHCDENHFQIRWSAASIEAVANSLGEGTLDTWKEASSIGMMEAMGTTESFDAVVQAVHETRATWQNGIPESLEAFTDGMDPQSLPYAQHCIAFYALTFLNQIANTGIKEGLELKTMFVSICEEPWFDDWLTHYQALDRAPRAYPSAAGRSPAHFQPIQTDDSEEPYHSPQNVTSSGKP